MSKQIAASIAIFAVLGTVAAYITNQLIPNEYTWMTYAYAVPVTTIAGTWLTATYRPNQEQHASPSKYHEQEWSRLSSGPGLGALLLHVTRAMYIGIFGFAIIVMIATIIYCIILIIRMAPDFG